jgi:hypothetical protein
MVVWRYLFQILLFAFDIYHDFEYPSMGTAQGARFGTSTVESTSPWSLDFGQTRLKQIISLLREHHSHDPQFVKVVQEAMKGGDATPWRCRRCMQIRKYSVQFCLICQQP